MRIADMKFWQVFMNRVGGQPGYEHVILPVSLLEKLEKDHTVVKDPRECGGYSLPINAVRLVSMAWVQLDGALDVPKRDLRTHDNAYRQGELADLRRAAKRLGFLYQHDRDGTISLADGTVYSSTGRAPAQPPMSESLSKSKLERLWESMPVKQSHPKTVQAAVDIRCVADPALLQLFAGTSVAREVMEGCRFGLRNKLRRAKRGRA